VLKSVYSIYRFTPKQTAILPICIFCSKNKEQSSHPPEHMKEPDFPTDRIGTIPESAKRQLIICFVNQYL
jgi:hypothetical protein